MKLKCCISLFWAVLVVIGAVQAQDNASLNGKYYFVQLLVDSVPGQPVLASNLGGAITFDGKGAYSYSGKLALGWGAATPMSGQGAYRVSTNGSVSLTSPIRNAVEVRAWLGCSVQAGVCAGVLVGAATEPAINANDIFMAFQAPAAAAGPALVNGNYMGASLRFADSGAISSSLVSLVANGSGQFTRAGVTGHASDQGGRNVSQDAGVSAYTVNADGSGSASFGAAASLFSGARELFVSPEGNYLLGYSSGAGARDIFIAIKRFSGQASALNLQGEYRISELTVEGDSFSAASGTLKALGNGRALFSERLHLDKGPIDYSGLNLYSLNSDGTGAMGPAITQDLKNMAIGAEINVGGAARAPSLVGAQVGAPDSVTNQYGVFFAVLGQQSSGAGVFLNPAGVVNAASFAPIPNPICPGAIVSLFGSGLTAGKNTANGLPLPTVLGGLSATINGTAAPLFFVSPEQANIQVPFGLKGNSATIQLTAAAGRSNEVTVPLAATSPGIFFYDDGQSPLRGTILHSDYTPVTPAKPARPGETVLIYLTGLGELRPAVPTGAANPAAAATALDSQIYVVFGGEAVALPQFAGGAPGFTGLNQINVAVPWTVRTGASVPVAIATGNAYSDVVDIPIR